MPSSQHAYIAALSTAQEAERGRLARELDDEVAQQLIALGHLVVQRLFARDPEQKGALRRLAPQSELALFRFGPIPFGSTCQRLARTAKLIGSSNATAAPATRPVVTISRTGLVASVTRLHEQAMQLMRA